MERRCHPRAQTLSPEAPRGCRSCCLKEILWGYAVLLPRNVATMRGPPSCSCGWHHTQEHVCSAYLTEELSYEQSGGDAGQHGSSRVNGDRGENWVTP
ncbi:unnamed protein product [Rangifer tarandus platyrhynchus]|uniref:Uncharacterized protein n=1 Tax=Rangifer tarandus platyrhynchus TaxID=3082113 RepID=A0AC59Z2A4_RANTA